MNHGQPCKDSLPSGMLAMKALLCLIAATAALAAFPVDDILLQCKGEQALRMLVEQRCHALHPCRQHVTATSPTVPEQIHINLANPSNDAVHSYSVAWATAEPTNTVVKFGDSADKLNRQVKCCNYFALSECSQVRAD
eukprot:2946-Heterococcus_DN1.PRE.2